MNGLVHHVILPLLPAAVHVDRNQVRQWPLLSRGGLALIAISPYCSLLLIRVIIFYTST